MVQKRKNTLLYALAAILALWLLIPGLGPDIAGVEHRYGWKFGPDDWRGPLSSPPTYHIATPQLAQLLDTVPIRNHREAPPYRREFFGKAWADVDHNGCDTRNDILARDLKDPQFKKGTHGCVVVAGELNEPYTGKTVHFQRGKDTSGLVQIDHVVALGDAWRSGAWRWSKEKREEFANSPENLIAVDGDENEEKGAGNAAMWLPPNTDFHCEYAEKQLRVKARWQLSMTTTERSTIERILSYCPAQ